MRICGIRDRIAPKNAVILDFLKGCGGELIDQTEFMNNPDRWDAMVTFSYTALAAIREARTWRIDHWMIEKPYVLNDGKISDHGWFRITRNRNQAQWRECPADRWEKFLAPHVKLYPWKIGLKSSHVLLCEATEDMNRFTNGFASSWDELAVHVLQKKYEVVKRPRLGNKDTIQEALSSAVALACYNSNAAVDAVIAGVPVVVSDESITRPVGNGLGIVEKWKYGNRLPLMHLIAYSQFTRQEMAYGTAWEILNR